MHHQIDQKEGAGSVHTRGFGFGCTGMGWGRAGEVFGRLAETKSVGHASQGIWGSRPEDL